MNPLLLYLASGESLYSGAIALLLMMALSPWLTNRWLLLLRQVVLWIAVALMAFACPPFPWWLDVLFFITLVAWLLAEGKPVQAVTPRRRRARITSAIALTALTLLLPALEIPWRLRPTLTGPRADHLVVIGDSISAGISNQPPWPAVLQSRTGICVTNLAAPGADAADALAQARKLTPADTLVLLEIGGNDLLAGTSAADFQTQLDQLLAACTAPGRTLVMCELPLLPHRIAYGRIQRRLAAQYHLQLIPKRFLVEVLAGPDATSDGLHLSPSGAEHMAAMVASLLEPLLPPSTSPASPH